MRPTLHALTSLRGFAAWWVVIYHFRSEFPATDWPTIQSVAKFGYLAVDLFFIMSGFIISLNYHTLVENLDLRTFQKFLGYRLARIYPLHLAILILFLVNPIAIYFFSESRDIGSRYDPAYFIQSLFLVQNWGFNSLYSWNFPAWSISVEWGAYLSFPLLASIMARLVVTLLQAGLVLIFLLITLAGVGAFAGSLGNDISHIGLARCLLEFSLGLLLFYTVRLRGNLFLRGDWMAGSSLLLLVIALSVNLPDYVFAPIGLLLMVAGMLDADSYAARALSRKWAIFIGEISYSTYLIHYFVKDWSNFILIRDKLPIELAFAVYLTVTAAASVLLYYTVELPARQYGRNLVDAWLARPRPSWR